MTGFCERFFGLMQLGVGSAIAQHRQHNYSGAVTGHLLARATLALVVASLFSAAPAGAHDSLAPPGAPHQWLPDDQDWVQQHWIPFDRAALEQALGLRGRQLEAFLFNDHHTLAELAARRGVNVNRLADRLVAPWRPLADAQHVALLRHRTLMMLTQGHLAQHMFFHVFHSLGSTAVAPGLFGVTALELDALRKQRMTPLEVAAMHGVPKALVTSGLVALFRAHRDEGVATHQSWPVEADRMLARQTATLPCWLRSLRPSQDPGNPYGKATRQHGPHDRSYPATEHERRADERRVEHVRRKLTRTCWPMLPAWRWPAATAADTAATGAVTVTRIRFWARRPAVSGNSGARLACAVP